MIVNNSTNINKMNNNNPHSINLHKKAYDIGNLSGSNRFIGSQPSLIDDWIAITYITHDKKKTRYYPDTHTKKRYKSEILQ